MKRIWELLPDVAKKVRQKHEEVGLLGHHDWVHAFRVGEVARRVAKREWDYDPLTFLAGLAGLCHNADRILQKEMEVGRREVPREAVVTLMTTWLQRSVGVGDIATVIDAVLKHDGKNSPEDSQVLIALMDADRVVNLDVDLLMRSGQFYNDKIQAARF